MIFISAFIIMITDGLNLTVRKMKRYTNVLLFLL